MGGSRRRQENEQEEVGEELTEGEGEERDHAHQSAEQKRRGQF
jgi:hypothetical protein